ncbi:MAG: molybdopterin-dependent oxidoreductase [Halanaeroarchaeum sp.]
MSGSTADTTKALASIEVVGERTVSLDADVLSSLQTATKRASVVCATGHREVATWTGVDVAGLCELVDAPPETTHVLLDSHDDYRMAVPIADALDGLLAFERDGSPLDEMAPYDNRFVAPAVDGARDVKGVRRVEFHALDPSSDPDALENVEPVDDRYAVERE